MQTFTINVALGKFVRSDSVTSALDDESRPHFTEGLRDIYCPNFVTGTGSGTAYKIEEGDALEFYADIDFVHAADSGTLAAAVTGEVDSITLSGLANDPDDEGTLLLDDNAVSIDYTAVAQSGDDWVFTVDYDFGEDSYAAGTAVDVEDPLMVESASDQFNIDGDRSDLDISAGLTSFRGHGKADAFSSKLAANADDDGNLKINCEIILYKSGNDDGIPILRDYCYAWARVKTIESTPGTKNSDYYKKTYIDNTLLKKLFSNYDLKETLVSGDSLIINNSADDDNPARVLFSTLLSLFQSADTSSGVTYNTMTLANSNSTSLALGFGDHYLIDFWIRDSNGYYFDGKYAVVNTTADGDNTYTVDKIDKGHATSETVLTEFDPDNAIGAIEATNTYGLLKLNFTLESGSDLTLNYCITGEESDDNMIIAVGYGTNSIAYSFDGVTWTGIDCTDIFSYGGCGACSNGEMFIAVGWGTNSIAYSSDGVTWTGLGQDIFSSGGQGVNWNDANEIFIAVGYGTNSIAYSSDGVTWTGLGQDIFSNGAYRIASNDDIIVAVGYGTNSIAYSTDGVNWTGLGQDIFSDGACGVCWTGTMFVANGYGDENFMAYSTDGINWTGLGLIMFTDGGMGICSNGEITVAVGYGTNSIAYSTDGINWTGLGQDIFSDGGCDVYWTGEMFIAMGWGTNSIAYSTDGITWTGLGQDIFSSGGQGICSQNTPTISN